MAKKVTILPLPVSMPLQCDSETSSIKSRVFHSGDRSGAENGKVEISGGRLEVLGVGAGSLKKRTGWLGNLFAQPGSGATECRVFLSLLVFIFFPPSHSGPESDVLKSFSCQLCLH